jgi:L-ascorbate metabolism protein UlaG (beta-lactamase superfamily)
MNGGEVLEPAWCGGLALQQEILASGGGADRFRLWWLGQSGFLLSWNGHFLLFDPYLSDSLTEKYGATDKPHVRLSERVIDPSLLGMVRLVTSSHLHTDHLDAATLWPLAAAAGGLQLVLPGANEAAARERLGDGAAIEYVTVEEGGTREVGVFRFTAVAAAHNEIERDGLGRCRFLSFVVRFGPFCVWHSGDTLWHDGLVAALRAARPDLVMVPINGNDPARRLRKRAGRGWRCRIILACLRSIRRTPGNSWRPAAVCSNLAGFCAAGNRSRWGRHLRMWWAERWIESPGGVGPEHGCVSRFLRCPPVADYPCGGRD